MTTRLQDTSDTSVALAGAATASRSEKYLTFRLANEDYGIQILKVREINGFIDVTAVPQMPAYMKGVINLRGKIIPVIDLRLKFRLPEAEHTEQTCIIVVDVGRELGIIVDAVSEVLDIPAADIETLHCLDRTTDAAAILGMGKVGDSIKILLDIARVLNTDELASIAASAEEAATPSNATEKPLPVD